MEQRSLTIPVLTIISFLLASLKNAKKLAQFTLKDQTKSAHYLNKLYLITAVPPQEVDLFTTTAKQKDSLFKKELVITNQ